MLDGEHSMKPADSPEHQPETRPSADLLAVAASNLRLLWQPRARLALALMGVFLLTVPVWQPLTSPGYVKGLDGPMAPALLYEMDRCFDDGQLPCRWTPDVGQGYGVPAFDYWGPLPSYVGELIHLSGVGIFETIHVLHVIAFILSGLFMFLLAREFWGNRGGLVAATFYTYAPWHASLVYVQGDPGEHWAMALFPAVLWASYLVIKDGKAVNVLLLILCTTALLLTHNLLVLMLFPLALVWVSAFLMVTKEWERLVRLAIAGVAAFSLAAFFTVPALLEQDLVHLERAKGGYYAYAAHFPTLNQLFLSRFWGYGISVPGPGDGLSFQIGWLHWALAAVFVFLAPFLWRKRAAFWAAAVCFAFFWASAFIMHSSSDFLWRRLSLLQWELFPFRFLLMATLTSSFLAGAAVALLRARPRFALLLSVTLVVAVVALNLEYFRAGEREFGPFDGAAWAVGPRSDLWVITQPKDATAVPGEPAPAKVQVIAGDADITQIEQGSASLAFAANSTSGARLQTSVADFPNWQVNVDGTTIPHDHANPLATVSFDLPRGSHSVELKLEDTAIRKLANYWSLTAWAIFIIFAGSLIARAGWTAFGTTRGRNDATADLPARG